MFPSASTRRATWLTCWPWWKWHLGPMGREALRHTYQQETDPMGPIHSFIYSYATWSSICWETKMSKRNSCSHRTQSLNVLTASLVAPVQWQRPTFPCSSLMDVTSFNVQILLWDRAVITLILWLGKQRHGDLYLQMRSPVLAIERCLRKVLYIFHFFQLIFSYLGAEGKSVMARPRRPTVTQLFKNIHYKIWVSFWKSSDVQSSSFCFQRPHVLRTDAEGGGDTAFSVCEGFKAHEAPQKLTKKNL